jgi:hypothetical protein
MTTQVLSSWHIAVILADYLAGGMDEIVVENVT